MKTAEHETVDEYIASAPKASQSLLAQMRLAIRESAPHAQESIGYRMPVYKQGGIVVYFGGFKDHVSLFPGPEAITAFAEELAGYETSRGTIRFAFNNPLPVTLIKKIVEYCVSRNISKAKNKKKVNAV